jgi:hypothetical protein
MNEQDLRLKLQNLVKNWQNAGLPSRDVLIKTAHELIKEKQDAGHGSLWPGPPLFATATVDDAWGHGLDIIELYAKAAGMRVVRLGLLLSAEEIISACRRRLPDFLAMTVLQIDTEEDLVQIGHSLPSKTRLIAGGPVFKARPDMARTAGIRFVAKDAAAFLEYLLSPEKSRNGQSLHAP